MSISNRAFPKRVFLREEGMREGFQIHPDVVPTADKLELIELLSGTGIQTMEVTSFVRPDRVPQMADAEKLAEGLPENTGVRYRALFLNERGFLRARTCKKLELEGMIPLAASEGFLRDNNNSSISDSIKSIGPWIELFKANQVPLERLMMSAAFGHSTEGKISAAAVIDVCARALAEVAKAGAKVPEVTLADTTGWANPETVRTLVEEFKSRWPELMLSLHLHDTRGTGMANVYAGLELGVDRFDASLAGLGGCPFSKGAAGNVPTEDVAFLCEEMGISTGLNLARYIECAKLAERIVGRKLPGKLKDGGLIS